MLTRRESILVAASALLASRAQAADTSAHDFVAAIYNTYVGKNGNGVALDNERTVRRYFEPSLAALILKDQKDAARRNEVGVLDFDPFVDAQDWDISSFALTVSETGSDKASATVKFSNHGTDSTIVLDLAKIKNEWKITNITWMPHDKPNNLRALYAQ
jgi:hypothetical protein